MTTINPQIITVFVGARTLREVIIYPLSLADQGKMARTMSTVFQSVMDALSHLGEETDELDEVDLAGGTIGKVAKQLANIDIAETIVDLISTNLEIILGLVVDSSEKITMEELTNEQFYTLIELIYEVNYEETSKNFLALMKRARTLGPKGQSPEKPEKSRKKVSHSRKPSPESAGGTTTS